MKLHKNVTNKQIINYFKTLEDKCNNIYNGKYCYSKFIYINSHSKSIIICPNHGEFESTMSNHLKNRNCPKCSNEKQSKSKRNEIKDVISRANKIHSNKYDYSKFNYINRQSKSIIICHEHGEFETRMGDHLSGKGCITCGTMVASFKKTKKLKDIIIRANEIHKNKYDYSKYVYKGISIKSVIVCKIHGEFSANMDGHINSKNGCPYCANPHKDNDCLYIWNIKGTDIYKIGVTSFRLKYKRIHKVATEQKVDYSIIAFVKVENALVIENKLHKTFNRKQKEISSGDGYTEFRELNEVEIISILDYLKIEMKCGELSYPHMN